MIKKKYIRPLVESAPINMEEALCASVVGIDNLNEDSSYEEYIWK